MLLGRLRVESERAWLTRVFKSITDAQVSKEMVNEYGREGQLMGQDALVSETRSFMAILPEAVANSVCSMSTYFSGAALQEGLESFIAGESLEAPLGRADAGHLPLRAGTTVADCLSDGGRL